MENQHRKIKGYRELNAEEIAAMNEIKNFGIKIAPMIGQLQSDGSQADQRWVAIGKTQIQQGLMALTRSIAKPDFF